MALSEEQVAVYSGELYEAWRERLAIAPLTERIPGITIDDAYRIQLRTVERRLQQGERHVGKKIGLTARVVQKALGVDQPDFGHLLSGMAYGDGDGIDASAFIQPRGEGEIGVILKRDISGPGLTNADVLAAIECVMPCFEIVDSRIADWRIKVQDTIADNGSSAAFVIGDRAVDPRRVDLATIGMVLEKNGEIIGTGAGAASLGNPLNAITWLANALGGYGITLKAGELILSGSLSILFPVERGDVLRMSLGGVGSASCRFY